MITDKIDRKLQLQTSSINLYDNFVENFILTGIIKKESELVDFERFKYVFFSHKMNIHDMIDLIAGAI
jgi:hypothetical protein